MLNAVQTWESKVQGVFGSIYTTTRRIVEVRIPAIIRAEVGNITSWVGGLVGAARNEARALVADVRGWAVSAYNGLTSWVSRIVTWADGRLHSLEDWLESHGRWITQLLSNPEILAQWLLLAMWHQLMRYMQANGVAIVRYLIRNALPLTAKAADDIESYIHDIL
jgi:hypothetical protein